MSPKRRVTGRGEQQNVVAGKFSAREANWDTIEQECYAIFQAVTKWRAYLLGRSFHVYTDHRNLSYILQQESKKILRWKLVLQEFVFLIHHIPGRENLEADILSRLYENKYHGTKTNTIEELIQSFDNFVEILNCDQIRRWELNEIELLVYDKKQDL